MAMVRVRVHDLDPENILLPPAESGGLADALKIKILQCIWDQHHAVESGSIAHFDAYFR